MKRVIILLLLIIAGCTDVPKKGIKNDIPKSEIKETLATQVLHFEDFRMHIIEGEVDKAKSIVDSFDVNSMDKNGETFFDHAINEDLEIIQFLLISGYKLRNKDRSDLFKRTKSDTSLFKKLYLTYAEDSNEVFSNVISSCEVDLLNIFLQQNKRFDFLFQHNTELNIKPYHCSCLLNLCDSTASIMLSKLLDYGMEVSQKENQCLLEYSMDEGIPRFATVEFIRALINSGYFIESSQWSPLQSTCFWNENNLVEFLLKNGYNPNWNNKSDMLYFALTRPGDGLGEHLGLEQRLKTIELLLNYGADPLLLVGEDFGKGIGNMNFFEFAKQWSFENNTELIKLIEKYKK